jgi:hypothetical protein
VVAVVVLLETVVVDTVVQVLTIRPSVVAVENPSSVVAVATCRESMPVTIA